MSGICSKHQDYDPECHLCTALERAFQNINKQLEIARLALSLGSGELEDWFVYHYDLQYTWQDGDTLIEINSEEEINAFLYAIAEYEVENNET